MADVKISLVAARVNASMTQREVADKIGVTRTTLHNWEKGNTKIPFNSLKDLCDLYSIPVDFISVPEHLTSS